MNRPDAVTRASRIQQEAAGPDRSAAVRASAGSGKTRVLVDRFVRLCVEGEHNDVHPRAILAITFTRKAATEIRERLLERARRLALAADDERRARLGELFAGRAPLPAEEDRAARLYERLLEDPSGLQVGTIHSFCQRILARFATEAGLDPHAGLIEDRDDLLDEALDRLMAETAADPQPAALAAELGNGPASVRPKVRRVFAEQMRVDRWLRRVAAAADTTAVPRVPLVPILLAELRAVLFGRTDLGDEVTTDDLAPDLALALAAFTGEGLDGVAAQLEAAERKRLAKDLQKLRDKAGQAGDAAAVRAVLLTQADKVRSFTLIRDAELKERFNALVLAAAAPVLAVLRNLDLVKLYRDNRALLTLGLRALDILDELKQRDRVIDFGDLEDMACRLMGDQARALSLLFRLEDSLRHVLVDEFQDTNFNQLDILEPFVAEFLSGGSGEAAVPPTVFLVGDLKQSIYGFRGAEPGIFAAMIERLERYGQGSHTLPTNFRSLPAVVDGVGLLFRREPLVSRLPAGEAAHVHQQAARDDDAGEVTLIAPYEDDQDGGHSGQQRAALAAARIVRGLIDTGTTTRGDDGRPRPLVWSDVMVLYRSRTGVSLYEEAFRRAGIPIEPAGRGMLAASREVQDLLALLRWLVWPEDEIALAVVLRSPIARLGEGAFQRLLAARGLFREGPSGRWRTPANLWATLRTMAADDDELGPVAARLQDWRADTGFVSCHELLRRICREGHLPERYAAARGPQARFNLERLYDLALSPEIAGAPTVRRFIELVDKAGRRGGHEEGTPGSGGDGGRVRFMTIHGAKGLEAPVVLLVDADRALNDKTSEVRLDPASRSPGLVFGATKSYRLGLEGAEGVLEPDPLQRAGEAAAAVAAIEETNLLYVAMTRARDRLYVLGGKGREKEDGEARSALRRLRRAAAAGEPPVRLDDPDGLERPPRPVEVSADPAATDRPVAIAWTPPALGGRPAVVAPSAAAQLDDPVDGGAALHARAADHGLKVHLWLQLAAERGSLPPGAGPARDEAAAVVADGRLAWILDPGTVGARGLSEAAVILARRDEHGHEERVTGIIDRLIVRPDRIDVIDYKTNRWGGDPERRAWLVEHYRPQLAAYAEAAAALFPGRTVRSWLLLTDPAGRGPAESGLVEVTAP